MRSKILAFLSISLIIIAAASLFPSSVHAQECGAPVPPVPTGVKAVSGPEAGEVMLYWDEASYANRYGVAYGIASSEYVYGADNIGGEGSRSYTVKNLRPGVRYYFRLIAARDCSSSPFSKEVSAVARGGRLLLQPEKAAVPIGGPAPVVKPAVKKVSVSGVNKARLSAKSGPKAGEVTLSWQHVDSAEDYHLVYGKTLGKYEYGSLNIGRVNSFTVRQLQPGTAYYFAIIPIFNNQPLYTTDGVKGVAKMRVTVIQTTSEALIKPKAEAKPKAPLSVKKKTTSKEPAEEKVTVSPAPPSSKTKTSLE